jgi:hypothetical protein
MAGDRILAISQLGQRTVTICATCHFENDSQSSSRTSIWFEADQPIQCYSERIFEYPTEGISEPTSRDLRFAGSRSRSWVFKLARQWNQGGSPFRLSIIDGWILTDNRPETSSEGRHWISEDSGELDHYRHGIGEPDGSTL